MKLSREFGYIVLCEDAQSQTFIVSFLRQFNINTRKIRLINYPCGKGCGSAFVRKEYPNEVRILKATNYLKTVLVVCVDADNLEVGQRKQMMEKEVIKVIPNWSREQEPIILWVPKREIETWISFLSGESVDETTDLKHSGNPVSCKNVAKKFAEYCQDLTEPCKDLLPSMVEAKKEYTRVCKLQKKSLYK